MVLQHSQPGGGLELLVIERKQVGLGLLDLVEHLLAKLLCGLDLLPLFFTNFGQSPRIEGF